MKSPEQGTSQPEELRRPTQLEIQYKLHILREAENDRGGREKYGGIIKEIKKFVGGGETEVRERFYPGWANEDLEELLRLMEQEKE